MAGFWSPVKLRHGAQQWQACGQRGTQAERLSRSDRTSYPPDTSKLQSTHTIIQTGLLYGLQRKKNTRWSKQWSFVVTNVMPKVQELLFNEQIFVLYIRMHGLHAKLRTNINKLLMGNPLQLGLGGNAQTINQT